MTYTANSCVIPSSYPSLPQQHRQIGNAVPVPLALALGKELGKALIKLWKQQEEREDEDRAQSPEIPVERDLSQEL